MAINFRKTVNAIGNYYHPMFNVIDLQFMDTLPERISRQDWRRLSNARLSAIRNCLITSACITGKY